MDRKKRPNFITVSQEEASLVQEADRIEARLFREAKDREKEVEEKTGRHLNEPMTFCDTPKEGAILQARDQLAQKHQEEQGLETPKILLTPQAEAPPKAPSNPYHPIRFHTYNENSQSNAATLTPSDLEDLFRQKVLLQRKEERLFMWEQFHYRRLSENEARGLIFEVLRDELRSGNAPALIGSVLSLLQSDQRIEAYSDETNSRLAVLNGAVDIATLQFCPSDSRFFRQSFETPIGAAPSLSLFFKIS